MTMNLKRSTKNDNIFGCKISVLRAVIMCSPLIGKFICNLYRFIQISIIVFLFVVNMLTLSSGGCIQYHWRSPASLSNPIEWGVYAFLMPKPYFLRNLILSIILRNLILSIILREIKFIEIFQLSTIFNLRWQCHSYGSKKRIFYLERKLLHKSTVWK